jgi:hypothetical protein
MNRQEASRMFLTFDKKRGYIFKFDYGGSYGIEGG